MAKVRAQAIVGMDDGEGKAFIKAGISKYK